MKWHDWSRDGVYWRPTAKLATGRRCFFPFSRLEDQLSRLRSQPRPSGDLRRPNGWPDDRTGDRVDQLRIDNEAERRPLPVDHPRPVSAGDAWPLPLHRSVRR